MFAYDKYREISHLAERDVVLYNLHLSVLRKFYQAHRFGRVVSLFAFSN